MIKNLEFDYEYISSFPRAGEGSYSIVYKDIVKNKAYKIYKNQNISGFYPAAIDNLFDFYMENYDLFNKCGVVCPDGKVYVRYGDLTRLNGLSFRLVNGVSILDFDNEDLNFDNDHYNKLIKELEHNIYLLSKEHIRLHDLNPANIMYDADNDKLVLIDADFWKKKDKVNCLLFENLCDFESAIEPFQLTK